MKKINIYLTTFCLVSLILLMINCSEDYLNVEPKASLSEGNLANKTGVDGILIGCYKAMTGSITGEYGGYSWGPFFDNPSDDRSTGTYNFLATGNNSRWVYCYTVIQRCNDVLRVVKKAVEAKTVTEVDALQFEGEAKFIRGLFSMMYLVGTFGDMVPWIDETISFSNGNYMVANDKSLWPFVESDLQFAANNLTETNAQVGRANEWAAKAFLAKALIWQLKYNEAKPILEDIITNGKTVNGKKYALNDQYWWNFNTVNKHGPECIFAIQNEVNTGAWGGNAADMYNGTYYGPATGCCGWLTPSEDLVNAYQTDEVTGLPKLFFGYRNSPIASDQGISSATLFTPTTVPLDSRLDWCIGRRGIPYLDWGNHLGMSWIRFPPTEGAYSAKKNIASQAKVAQERQNQQTTNAYNLMRYAEILLMAAETEVEIGSLSKAEEYVNMVRARAANPVSWVYKYLDDTKPMGGFSTTPAANYKVGLYTGQFAGNGKTYAREAVFMEYRLELALEHHRWNILQRRNKLEPGYMATTLNSYLEWRKNQPGIVTSYVAPYQFVAGKHEIWPIPQTQIDLMVVKGASLLKQNPGY